MTLYTHESACTQCFPVRFALKKTGDSLSIEMTVALEVLWFTNLNYHEQRWQRLPPRLNCLQSQQVDRLGARTKSATNGWPVKPLTRAPLTPLTAATHQGQFHSCTRHKPNGCHPSPFSTRLGWRFSETSQGPPPWEAPGRNRPSSVHLLNPVRLLLLLVGVVSSACSSF